MLLVTRWTCHVCDSGNDDYMDDRDNFYQDPGYDDDKRTETVSERDRETVADRQKNRHGLEDRQMDRRMNRQTDR